MLTKIAITIDVEPPVSENVVLKILGVLGQYRIPATFFFTGRVLEHHKDLAFSLIEAGHELALHGYKHSLWQGKNIERKKDIARAIDVFKDVVGEHPAGFRAPYGNMDEATMRVLEENGMQYDSSILPTLFRVERRKITPQSMSLMRAPQAPYHPSHEDIATNGNMHIVEIPFSVLPIVRLPIGLGYVLLFGLNFFKFFVQFYHKDLMTVYFHPYELCKQTLSAGAPSEIRRYYGRDVDPLTVLTALIEFLMVRFRPNFIRMEEIV